MRFIKYLIIGIIILYIQIILVPKLSMFGVLPLFLIPFVIFISYNLKYLEAITLTFFITLAFDLIHPYILGANTLLLLILSHIVNRYHITVTKDKLLAVVINISILNLLYILPMVFIRSVLLGFDFAIAHLYLIEFLYNIVITTASLYVFTIARQLKVVIDV